MARYLRSRPSEVKCSLNPVLFGLLAELLFWPEGLTAPGAIKPVLSFLHGVLPDVVPAASQPIGPVPRNSSRPLEQWPSRPGCFVGPLCLPRIKPWDRNLVFAIS